MCANKFVQLKIKHINEYVGSELSKYSQVKGVVIVGSVSEGTCREDSDIDVYVFFKPLDLTIMPGEFRWDSTTGRYFTIFEQKGTVQIDAKRVDLEEMSKIEWPDEWKYELASGIIIYDPEDEIKKLLRHKIRYPESLRRNRLMNAILRIGNDCIKREWATVIRLVEAKDFLFAHELLNVALEEILKVLYSYNRTFMPWRNKWLARSFSLPWLPRHFRRSVEESMLVRELGEQDVIRRLTIVQRIFEEISRKLIDEGTLPEEDPIGHAFCQTHKEIGYAWNMDIWLKAHQKRAANA